MAYRALTTLLLTILALPANAQEAEEPPVTFHPHAQERARFELLPDRTFADPVSGWQVGNRARLGLEARFGELALVMLQVQDVRTWGSEFNGATGGEGTLFDWDADGLDMHQAYGQVNMGDVGLRIGRQEIAWHGQRLIGSVLWTHQGRSFDAVRVFGEHETVGYDLFYAMLLNRPVGGDTSFTVGEDAHLIAFRAGPRLGKGLALDGLFIGRIDQGTDSFLGTFGAHAKGKAGAFVWEAEAYGQVGKDPADTYGAYLFGVRAGAELDGGHQIGGGFDLLSGTNDSGSIRTFDTLYATNHKFYGHFDAYLAPPVHTAGEGLIDGLVHTRFRLHRNVNLMFDAHVFASAAAQDEAFHGVEFDTNLSWKPHEVVTVATGVWVYVPGAFWGSDLDPSVGAHLSTDFQIK